MDSMSPPPLAAKPKKGKSQTVASTLPKPPTETKESPPKPTKGSEQSHSVSSDTVPNPQDLEIDIQLASTGLPSTLDEGTPFLLSEDELEKESDEEEVLAVGDDMDEDIQADEELLKDINNDVKDDSAANQKMNEATETFARISSNITEVLSLVKGFDFSALLSNVKDLQAHALKQEEASVAWTKSSTNMA
ncbi:hypothetical protein Tco_1164033 [Tanacetum coccineum]